MGFFITMMNLWIFDQSYNEIHKIEISSRNKNETTLSHIFDPFLYSADFLYFSPQTMVLPKQTHTKVVMSPAMTSQLFLNSMLGQIMELKHRATNTLTGPGQVPPATKSKQTHLFFIDDLNMASSNPEGG